MVRRTAVTISTSRSSGRLALLGEPVQPRQTEDKVTTGSPFAEPSSVEDLPEALVPQVRILIDEVECPAQHVGDGCPAGQQPCLGLQVPQLLAAAAARLEVAVGMLPHDMPGLNGLCIAAARAAETESR